MTELAERGCNVVYFSRRQTTFANFDRHPSRKPCPRQNLLVQIVTTSTNL